MGMNVGSGGEEDAPMVDMNTTPLIDVMLVLLIMLIITIPVQTHAVNMNMPVNSNQPPPPKPPEIVKIDVDFDGTVYWQAEPLANRAELQVRLFSVAQMADQSEVHLKPNKLVEYKHVAMVLAEAQRLGVTKIGIVGNEQFMN